MASDAEMCKSRAAELRQKAAEATNPTTKDGYLKLAQCWDEVLREIEAVEGRNAPNPD
jgi:hypothetical protein